MSNLTLTLTPAETAFFKKDRSRPWPRKSLLCLLTEMSSTAYFLELKTILMKQNNNNNERLVESVFD